MREWSIGFKYAIAQNAKLKLSSPIGSVFGVDDEDIDAVIFSKDDLFIQGEGTLNITANYNDGITSKDDLTIDSGTINITSTDDAIKGKDSVTINSGTITINSKGDGI